MKSKFLILFLLLSGTFSYLFGNPDSLYTSVLKETVTNGLVNYEQLKKDKRLNRFLEYLKKTDPYKLNKEDQLAFWINTYNAYTLKIILDNYPLESINELHSGGRILAHIFKSTVWDKDFVIVNNKQYTLNDIEHEIIRKKYKDPRIHFALVCASISCPQLRNEAYIGSKLNEQLNNQANIFFNDKTKNIFDKKKRVAYLSKILDWYEDDFGNDESEVLKFISNFLPTKLAKDIRKNADKWEIEYLSYNWDLNKYED